MHKDFYIQPDAPDVVLTDEQVLALARQHEPNARTVTGVDETGGEARTYGIDENLILKVQRPQQLRPSTGLRKEVLFLDQLKEVEGVRVPEVVGYGHPEPLIEYTLMTRMPGIAVREAALVGEPRRESLLALGRMIRRIHSIPQDDLRGSGLLFGDQSPVDVRWRLGRLFDTLAEIIHNRELEWRFPMSPEQVGRSVMANCPDSWEVVALHSNPGPEHTFVDPDNGALTGIIDFGDAYFSHPIHDLRRCRSPADREAVFTGYFEEFSPSEEFLAMWRVGCAVADVVAIALEPELREDATRELDRILSA